jgi:hypothetical protein
MHAALSQPSLRVGLPAGYVEHLETAIVYDVLKSYSRHAAELRNITDAYMPSSREIVEEAAWSAYIAKYGNPPLQQLISAAAQRSDHSLVQAGSVCRG